MSVPGPAKIWYGSATWAQAARGALTPAGWLYAAATTLRNGLYDVGALPSRKLSLPALSVGNVSVGGTGKTPVAAWAAARLTAAGARPAMVMRGYGDDEPLVHRRLNPSVLVVIDRDRVRGVDHAKAGGADCVILDDAFQHRRAARMEDWVLVAAEQWEANQRCLPAGPLREPVRGLGRATALIVTRKSASRDAAEQVAARVHALAPHRGLVILHLAPSGLVDAVSGTVAPLDVLRGARVLAIAAVGAPDVFFAQLGAAGADVHGMAFADHHPFDADDAVALAGRAAGFDLTVCTLKDAVKLGAHWPHDAGPLWYVSQSVVVERGAAELDASLAHILEARASAPSTAGSAGLASSAHGYRPPTAHQ